MGMIEINPRNIRTWSMLGQRGSVFTIALPKLAENDEKIIVLTADLGVLSGLERFKNTFPDRYLNMGIAEQNMIGVAYGLANEGNCVFATTYATFLTMRCFEQIRNNLGLLKGNVKLIGSSAGMAMETSGNCHHAIEDIALMRAIPNMTVLSPADGLEAIKILEAAYEIQGPVYIRLTGGLNCPIVYKEDFEYKIGRVNILEQGEGVALLATGTLVGEALKAAKLLKEVGIMPTVIDVHTIKPLPQSLDLIFKEYEFIITAEEHSIIGGLGSAVAERMSSENYKCGLLRLGIRDEFPALGEYSYLLQMNALDAAGISSAVMEQMGR